MLMPDVFGLGFWAIPTILANTVLAVLLGLQRRYDLGVRGIFNFIKDFDVSKKVALIVFVLLMIIYLGMAIPALEKPENYSDSNKTAKIIEDGKLQFGIHVGHYILTVSSFHIFGNAKIFPLIGSMGLLVLVYFFSKELTQKRISGLVSAVIVIQSPLFLEYSISYTYPIFWSVFYLASLYLMLKKWYLSAPVYVISFLSKALVALFYPMSIYFLYKTRMPRKQKVLALSTYGAIPVIGVIAAWLGLDWTMIHSFNQDTFLTGFKEFSRFMSGDWLITIFLVPLIAGLFLKSKQGARHADSIMFLIAGILISFPLLTGFTSMTNQPYRFTPLVIFFAIGVGMLFARSEHIVNFSKSSLLVFLFSIITAIITSVFVLFPDLIQGSYRLIL